ncbi:MAG: molybdopterin dinucleotide binding domain-containing protein, partial [Pseudomonadota bacterium]
TFSPTRWPVTASRQGGRFFADGRFFHVDRKARLLPVTTRAPAAMPDARHPFRFNTGRVRDHWHTMTRTGLSPRLSAHLAEPFLEVHPGDAADLGLGPADLVEVQNAHGRAILRVRITDSVQRGHVFAPMHWTGETAAAARIDALVAGVTDPVSGQPESKAATVSVTRFEAAWYGFAVSRQPMRPTSAYWALAATKAGYRMELAGATAVTDWTACARHLFGLETAAVVSAIDARRQTARLAFEVDGRVAAALFVSRAPVAAMRDYLADLPEAEPAALLTGRRPADAFDPGPTLCSCFGVGVNTIVAAIETRGLISVEEIGRALQAGTNCGSCRPEIAALLNQVQRREAAE